MKKNKTIRTPFLAQKGGIRIAWFNISESNPKNKVDDMKLLKFNISVLNKGKWEQISYYGFETQIPACADVLVLKNTLKFLMKKFYEPIINGTNIDELIKMTKYLSPELVKK